MLEELNETIKLRMGGGSASTPGSAPPRRRQSLAQLAPAGDPGMQALAAAAEGMGIGSPTQPVELLGRTSSVGRASSVGRTSSAGSQNALLAAAAAQGPAEPTQDETVNIAMANTMQAHAMRRAGSFRGNGNSSFNAGSGASLLDASATAVGAAAGVDSMTQPGNFTNLAAVTPMRPAGTMAAAQQAQAQRESQVMQQLLVAVKLLKDTQAEMARADINRTRSMVNLAHEVHDEIAGAPRQGAGMSMADDKTVDRLVHSVEHEEEMLTKLLGAVTQIQVDQHQMLNRVQSLEKGRPSDLGSIGEGGGGGGGRGEAFTKQDSSTVSVRLDDNYGDGDSDEVEDLGGVQAGGGINLTSSARLRAAGQDSSRTSSGF